MAEPVRMIEESEDGLRAIFEIFAALFYLILVVPIMLVVDLIRLRRRRRGRHRA